MVKLNIYNRDQYVLEVSKTSYLNNMTGLEITNVISKSIKKLKNTNLIIDLHEIKEIDADGYHYLMDIMKLATSHNFNIHFTNVSEQIDELISNLTETSES